MKIARRLLALAVVLVAACATAPTTPAPRTRAEAQEIVANMRRIVTEHGVERLESVEIGGVQQWVSIRGADRRNPILLFLHGGPGYVQMPTAWHFTRAWEDHFTIVHWDQRGAGRTYASAANQDAMIESLSYERMIADAEEMLAWLRAEFGKERIFVLGQSWGSMLGVELERRHPEQLHAYIGVGQAADMMEGERRGYAWVLARARADNNAEAIAALEAIAPYAETAPPTTEHLLMQRRWLGHYGGVVYGRTDSSDFTRAARLSPDYTDRDVALVWQGNARSVQRLFPELWTHNLNEVTELRTPVILLSGRHDYNVNSQVGAEWLARLDAPAKIIVWFEYSAHQPTSEEPGRALAALLQHALPIAERAGDVAPYGPAR
jgi:pimeloyl-ACP methyl ester carboxylesterase